MAIDELLQTFRADLHRAQTPEAIQELRVRYLGKKSELKTALKSLGGMSAEERPRVAKEINDAAQEIEHALDEATARIASAAVAKQIETEWQDLRRGSTSGGAPELDVQERAPLPRLDPSRISTDLAGR